MAYNCFDCNKEFGANIPSSVIIPDVMMIREVFVNVAMI